MTHTALIENLLLMSAGNTWEEAKEEWEKDSIFYIGNAADAETCVCGHHPIRECHVLLNTFSKTRVVVGNCCINQLGDSTYNKAFDAIKENRLNPKLVDIAYKQKIINDWEYKFASSVCLKRTMTSKQLHYYNTILNKIINEVIK